MIWAKIIAVRSIYERFSYTSSNSGLTATHRIEQCKVVLESNAWQGHAHRQDPRKFNHRSIMIGA